MYSVRLDFLCAPNVVDIVRVAAINEDVASLEEWREIRDGFIDYRCRYHQPDCSWFFQLLH